MTNSVIEQSAFIRATADKKEIDLERYKQDVRKEMKYSDLSEKGRCYVMLHNAHTYYFVCTNGLNIPNFYLFHDT